MIEVTSKIGLRVLAMDDAPDLLRLIENNRADLARFLYWVADISDVESVERYISQRIHSGLPNSQWFVVHLNDNPVGIFAVKYISTKTDVAELGYWLSAEARGQSLIHKLIEHIRKPLAFNGAKIIELRCLEKNVASIKIGKDFGAKQTAMISKHSCIDGYMQDLLIYQFPCTSND